jgi:hypothetical protein
MPFLPDNLKDWVEMFAAAGGVIGALVVFGTGAYTARQELRRKHAEVGRSLVTEMCDDPEAQNAFAMLDMEDDQKAKLKDGDKNIPHLVEWETVVGAIDDIKVAEKEPLIREAFDSLFYYFAMLENSIQAELVRLKDIEYPTSYYIRILGRYKPTFESYLQGYELCQALTFLKRWKDWNAPVSPKPKKSPRPSRREKALTET